MEAISRKGLSGLCGPDSPEGDIDYPLNDSPRNDSSNQNDNDFAGIIQNRNQINSGGKIIYFVDVHIIKKEQKLNSFFSSSTSFAP